MRTTEVGVRDQWDALIRAGAVREGHFELASGLHTAKVIDARRAPSWLMDEVYDDLMKCMRGVPAHALVGVPHGADHFAEYIAPMLPSGMSLDGRMRAVKITKTPSGTMAVPEGVILQGEEVIVLEDVFTTGGSLEKACQALVNAGVVIVGKFAIFNRSSRDGMAEEQGVQYSVRHAIADYEPAACPLCAEGIPLEKA